MTNQQFISARGMPWLCFFNFAYISLGCDIFHWFVTSFPSLMSLFFSTLGERELPSSQLPDNRTIQNFVEDYVDEYVG